MKKYSRHKYIYYIIISIILLFQLLLNSYDDNIKKNNSGKLVVDFIDVGQGDAILITSLDGTTMLIDAGDNSEENRIVQYLKGQGIQKIDYVVGTHPHADHIGGLDAVIENFEIGQIYMPKKSHTTKTFKDVLLAVKNKAYTIQTAKAGVKFELGPGVNIEMVAPVGDTYEEMNNYSAVIRLSYNDISFLFTGDAEKISEYEMLELQHALKSTVLKVGHHGSVTSTTEEFLQEVDPQYAVIFSRKNNDYGHPHRETIEKLDAANIEYFNTQISGTIRAITDGQMIEWIEEGSSTYSK